MSFQAADMSEQAFQLYERLGWVYGAVRRVSLDVSGLPWKLFAGKGKQENPLESGAMFDLLEEPNSLQTFRQLMQATISYLETVGAAYLLFFPPPLPALWPLRPDRVQPLLSPSAQLLGWEYRGVNGVVVLPPEAIVPFTYFSPREPIGGHMSPLMPVNLSAQGMIAAMAWNVTFFERGASPSGVLESDLEVDETAYDRVKADVADNWSGLDGAHGIPVLTHGFKWKSIEAAHKDMGYEGLLRLSREEVLGSIGVPPAIVGDYKNANYAQVEAQLKSYWEFKLKPIIQSIEETLTRFVSRMVQDGVRFTYDLSGVKILQEDLTAKAQREQIQIANGTRTRKELREADGLPSYPGAEEPLIATSLVPYRTKAELDEQAALRARSRRSRPA